MSPSAAIKEIQENGIDAEFSKYFDLFAKDHMSILGDVFPYLMPKDDLLKFATAFFVKYPLLGDFYFEFKKRFPDAPFANYADGIVSDLVNLILPLTVCNRFSRTCTSKN